MNNKKVLLIIVGFVVGVLLLILLLPTIFLALFVSLLAILAAFFVSPPLFTFLTFGAIITLSYVHHRNKKRSYIAQEERAESVNDGALEEPQVFRNLNQEEELEFETIVNSASRIRRNRVWLAILFLLMDYVYALIFRYTFDLQKTNFPSFSIFFFFVLLIGFVLTIFQLVTLEEYHKENDYYLDLRSPVFKVQGKLIKEVLDEKRHLLIVRGLKFSARELYSIKEDHHLKEGDEIAVEYSPRTKHVWKIYKTEDI